MSPVGTRSPDPDRLLKEYLQHHWLAARAGLDRFRRVSRTHREPEARRALARLADDIAEDREELARILGRFEMPRLSVAQRLMSLGESLGTLKPNGSLLRRTALTDLFEIEMLIAAVEAKKMGWLALRRLADDDPRLHADDLDRLIQRADDQQQRLEHLHRGAARSVHSANG